MLVVFSSGVCMLWDWKAPSKKPLEKHVIDDPSVSSYNQADLSMCSFYIVSDMHAIEMYMYINHQVFVMHWCLFFAQTWTILYTNYNATGLVNNFHW